MNKAIQLLLRCVAVPVALLAFTGGFATGCLDYDLDEWGDDEVPPPADPHDPDPEDPDARVTEQGLPEDEPENEPEDDPIEEELPPCDETIEADWQWWGSMPFEHSADLTDSDGYAYHEWDFQMVDFSTVSIPDQGHIPSGYDKVYRAEFYLDQMPPALFLSMQSDDGISFYINDQLVGSWGGDWQEEGCVNDNAGCTESTTVPPVDVTDFLELGTNIAAARVSNPVDNSYFEVYTECVD